MPLDLIYYGAMALIFVGIIAASAAARKARRADRRRDSGNADRPGD